MIDTVREYAQGVGQRVQIYAESARQRVASSYAWSGVKTVASIGAAGVHITSELCKEVGGVRSLAGGVSSVIRGIELFGKDVGGFATLATTLETANKGLGVPHVFQRIHEFTLDKTYQTANYLAARISFLVKDVITFVKFLQDMAVVSISTAKMNFLTSWAKPFEYTGWGLDASHNISELYKEWGTKDKQGNIRYLTFDRGCVIALDLAKLGAISFEGGATVTLKALRLVALFGTSAVKMVQQVHKHVNTRPAAG
ncbi:MAG: hypothetical protein JSR37_00485 [Verrucomicrobia bacterium]|nr:hypothetical protein [Verrucomicrobiota bacterium]MBS0635955.1 hypothetical protein [Verrucomicrobiota bacterium]